jgi:Protein of unknown function (DUF2628)
MAVYTVHEPPSRGSAPEPERFVFVRDGFSPAALLFGPLWMLRHRMWLVLLGYVAVVGALSVLLHLHGSALVDGTAWALLALLLGFEAGTLRRFTLARRGFRNIGIVVGDDLESAERRFFDSWVGKDSQGRKSANEPSEPRGAPAARTGVPLPASSPMPHPILGLFPDPRESR